RTKSMMSVMLIIVLLVLLIARMVISAYHGQNYQAGRNERWGYWLMDAVIAVLAVLYIGILTGRILTLVVPMG
ncbi:MAG TPA: hypothetical protein VHO48_14495, partial [Anaerolineaceae bacterium]|nr:hypothetical protein [Anaerolineaceae bacterium]